jgi:hypothetical protein
VVQANSGSTNDESRTLDLYCPARTVALGGGADISGVVEDWIEAMTLVERRHVDREIAASRGCDLVFDVSSQRGVSRARPSRSRGRRAGGAAGRATPSRAPQQPDTLVADGLVDLALSDAAASASVRDYEIVSEVSPDDSDATKSVEVLCPLGTALLGGGTAVLGDDDGTSLVTSQPLVDSGEVVGWQSIAREMIPNAGDWELRSSAICGNVPGLERVTNGSPLSSSDSKSVEVFCPAGKLAISGGFDLDGSTTDVAVYRNAPILDEESNEPIGWTVTAFEVFPTDGLWSADVQVLCADLDVVVSRGTSGSSSERLRSLTMFCPGRTLALGGGSSLVGIVADWIAASGPSLTSSAWMTRYDRDAADTGESLLSAMVVCPEPDRALLTVTAPGALCLTSRRQRGRARRSNT